MTHMPHRHVRVYAPVLPKRPSQDGENLFDDERFIPIDTILGIEHLFAPERGALPTPEGIARFFRLLELRNNQRFVIVLYFYANGELAAVDVEPGTPEESELLTPFRALRKAIFLSANAMIVAQNLPGDADPRPTPRAVDRTLELQTAGAYMGVQLRDHIVIGRHAPEVASPAFFSFRNQGILPCAVSAQPCR
jgi:DNA repair protein RadC